MPDYNFLSFSPRSFEHLIQALCQKILGPGIRVHGDGPDGGREASFRGRVPYPSAADCWEGYGVVQAKFRQKEAESDGPSWLIQQLSAELEKFKDHSRRLRSPEYYIIVTNVTLSPMERTTTPKAGTGKGRSRRVAKGGEQKLDEFMASAKGVLWTKGYAIWHADTLARFLDANESVRRTYACWLTSSDVLAEMAEAIRFQRPNFLDIMTRFLARELWDNRWANLDHTGHCGDDHTLLANVFFDLPYALITPDLLEHEGPKTLAAYLINVLRDKMDPDTLAAPATLPLSAGPERNRFVLLGGPGQGKSTLSQFLAQLYRAALLKDRSSSLEAEKRKALSGFIKQCEQSKIALPDARRFPIRVELPRFADSIGSSRDSSLLAYLARHIGETADTECNVNDLREWLIRYPWVLVLDGLDEVPASGNRALVLKAIGNFWDEVAGCRADIAMIVTTRPQGFNNDLAPAYYNHVQLSKLTPKIALAYAERLLDHRVTKEQARKTAMERLTAATEKPATARLMTSPLQVTIMAALVQGKGELPRDRWSLFKGYYEVIRDREANKPEAVSRMLKEYTEQIEFVHQIAGLVLQIESERAGGADATMPLDRLRRMVSLRLVHDGYSDDEARKLAGRIVGESMTRLVLLASEKDDHVGFEVRSLQEFMAASALMNGPDTYKVKRLEHIAGKGHWRHVFLLAAGRCFSDVDAEYLRDSVYRILEDLDECSERPLFKETFAGARLALELLEDANAANKPMAYRRLLRRALHLLAITDNVGFADRIAAIYQPDGDREIKQAICDQWTRPNKDEVCRLLLQLNERGITWATNFLFECLPHTAEPPFPLLARSIPISWRADNILNLMRVVAEKTDTELVFSSCNSVFGDDFNNNFQVEIDEDTVFYYNGLEMEIEPRSFSSIVGTTDYVLAVNNFSSDCNTENMAKIIEEIAKCWPEGEHYKVRWMMASELPSIIANLINYCKDGEELFDMADAVRCGDYGSAVDWNDAEERLMTLGITPQDLEILKDNRLGFGRNVAEIGLFIPNGYGKSANGDISVLQPFIQAAYYIKSDVDFSRMLDGVLFIAGKEIPISEDCWNRFVSTVSHDLIIKRVNSVFTYLPESRWIDSRIDGILQSAAMANREILNYEDVGVLSRHFRKFPNRMFLLSMIATSNDTVSADLIDLAMPFMNADQPAIVQAAFAVLCLRNGRMEHVEISRLAPALMILSRDWSYRISGELLRLAAAGDESVVQLALGLVRCGVHGLHEILAIAADQEQSGFEERTYWDEAGLPNGFHVFAAVA